MSRFGIRAKLTFSYAALFALLLMFIGIVVYRTVSVRLDHAVNERLTHFATGVWGHMEIRHGVPALVDDKDDFLVRAAARYFQLYDPRNGRLLAQSEDSAVRNFALSPEEVKNLKAPVFSTVTAGGTTFRFYSRLFEVGHDRYLLRVGLPLVQSQAARRELINTLLLLIPAVVLLAGGAGWWMAGRALKPVQTLRAAAHEISISRLNRRLPLRNTRDELDSLAQTFNEVFARLEEAVANMKQFTTSISHELRTPLAALQGEAETALSRAHLCDDCRQVLTSQLEEFQKLKRLVNRLLELARAEAGQIQLSNQPCDLSAMARSLGEQIEPIAASRNIALEVKCADGIQVIGDPQWLERAVLNIIDNAIKFTPDGGKVGIHVLLRNGSAVVEVSDSGIGIPPEAISQIFSRFYRLNRSTQVEGVGLGLAIAKWIVDAHEGAIEVSSALGKGSRFTVSIPRVNSTSLAAVTETAKALN